MSRLIFFYVTTLLFLFATSALSLEAGLYKVTFNAYHKSYYTHEQLRAVETRPGNIVWMGTFFDTPYFMQAEIFISVPRTGSLNYAGSLTYHPGPSANILQAKTQRMKSKKQTVTVYTPDGLHFQKSEWDLTIKDVLFANFRVALAKFLGEHRNGLAFRQIGFAESEDSFLEQHGGAVTQEDFQRLAYWFELK